MKKVVAVLALSLLVISPGAKARQASRSDFVEDINILFLRGDYAALIRKTERPAPERRLGRKQKKEIL